MTVYTYLQRRKKMFVMTYLYNLEIITTEDKISNLLKLKLWNDFWHWETCSVGDDQNKTKEKYPGYSENKIN